MFRLIAAALLAASLPVAAAETCVWPAPMPDAGNPVLIKVKVVDRSDKMRFPASGEPGVWVETESHTPGQRWGLPANALKDCHKTTEATYKADASSTASK